MSSTNSSCSTYRTSTPNRRRLQQSSADQSSNCRWWAQGLLEREKASLTASKRKTDMKQCGISIRSWQANSRRLKEAQRTRLQLQIGVNPFFYMAFAWMYNGECAHEQHLRRTLTLTLTLTHTITAYSVSGNVVRVRILICATRQKPCRKKVYL